MARRLCPLVAMVVFASLGCFARLEPAIERPSEEADTWLSQEEVRKAFAAIVARMTGEMVGETGETVTGVEIDEPDDPLDEPVTVHVAAVQWLTCGCCSDTPADTPFYDADLALVGRLERIGGLTVNRTRITDAGLQMLSRHPALTHLDLSSNQLTDEALRHIGHLRNLEVLNLSNTQITGTGLRYLKDLDRLRELRLNHAPVIDDALQYLSGLKGLERLHLDSTPVTGAGFARVRGLDRLEQLSLNQSSATSEGLAHLPAFPSLRKFAAAGTAIADQGLAALGKLEALEELNLSRAAIGDGGLSHLTGLRALRSLHANDTSITDEGLRHLAEAVALETINLANTGVKGFGINHLRDCLGLRVLRLDHSSRDGGIQADAETLETLNRFKGLESLTLDLSQESSAPDVVLSGMSDLQLLVIHCGPSMGRIELSDMSRLRTLEIRGMDQPRYGLSDQGLVDAETVPRIEEITLRNVGETPSGGRVRGYTLPIRTVLPQVLRLDGLGNAFFPEITGRVQAEHAEALAAFDVARVDAIAGSDPVAVAAMFSGEKNRLIGGRRVTTERWTKAWSEAFRDLTSPAGHLTMYLARVDADAPIDLRGMTELKSLTLVGMADSEQITVEGLPPGMQQLRLQDAELGTLVLRGCYAPIECRQVRRFDRLVASVGPRKNDWLNIFVGGNSPAREGFVAAPEVLELDDMQDVRLCSLGSGLGLKRVEVHGEGPKFATFRDIPSSVVEITWEGREPGPWQGTVFRR